MAKRGSRVRPVRHQPCSVLSTISHFLTFPPPYEAACCPPHPSTEEEPCRSSITTRSPRLEKVKDDPRPPHPDFGPVLPYCDLCFHKFHIPPPTAILQRREGEEKRKKKKKKGLFAELLFFKITSNCFRGVSGKTFASHLPPRTWPSPSCGPSCLPQHTRCVPSIIIAEILLLTKGALGKRLPSTRPTGSLICHPWAEGSFQ